MTPDASPQEIETKPNKNEEAKKVANSQASHDLASLNERKAMVDEFNSLIEKPKDVDNDESTKVRRSKRIHSLKEKRFHNDLQNEPKRIS